MKYSPTASRPHEISRFHLRLTTNEHAWYSYFGDRPVSKRWELHLEGQWRRHDLGLKWQQLLLRPGVNFELNPNVILTAGYGFVDTFRYGDYPTAYRFP